jgi:hypothetical protein
MKVQRFNKQFFYRSGIEIPERKKRKIFSIGVLAFMLITLTAIFLRLYISFSHELILGVDGGYYPLQVRNILNTGFLSYKDVPLYFYFCAAIVKVISFLGFTVTNEMIVTVIKIIDSMALPLLAIPLYKMVTRKSSDISFPATLAILSFAILSFTPLFILGDLQKNAFAIPMVFVFISLIEEYLISPDRRKLVGVVLSLVLIALTHFGVFAFCLVFLIVILFIIYRKKALIPSLIAIFIGFGMIALFDFNRAFRLITFWKVIFERPAIFQGPLPLPILVNVLFSWLLVGLGIFQFRKFRNKLDKASAYMLVTLIVMLAIFAFPLYDQQYFQRFNVLLFIPQLLLILHLIRLNQKFAVPFTISLVLLTTLSIFMYFSEEKRPCIDDLAFQDLQNINKYLPENKENSIVIASHGLEFWTAWALNVKVGQDRATEKIGLDKYRNVIFLRQKGGLRTESFGGRPSRKPGTGMGGHPPLESTIGSINGSTTGPPKGPANGSTTDLPRGSGMDPRKDRPVPEDFKLVYCSSYFNAYQKIN